MAWLRQSPLIVQTFAVRKLVQFQGKGKELVFFGVSDWSSSSFTTQQYITWVASWQMSTWPNLPPCHLTAGGKTGKGRLASAPERNIIHLWLPLKVSHWKILSWIRNSGHAFTKHYLNYSSSDNPGTLLWLSNTVQHVLDLCYVRAQLLIAAKTFWIILMMMSAPSFPLFFYFFLSLALKQCSIWRMDSWGSWRQETMSIPQLQR